MINILTDFAATTGATRIGQKLLSEMTLLDSGYQDGMISDSVKTAVNPVDVGPGAERVQCADSKLHWLVGSRHLWEG